MEFIIVFDSTHKAIETEEKLEAFDVRVMPTPRQISASCGISIRVDIKYYDEVKSILKDEFRFYRREEDDYILL